MKSLKINITHNLSNLDKVKIDTLSNEHRLLYNKLLEQAKLSSDFKTINQTYKDFRNNSCLTINSKSAQNTSRTLINNIKSFFKLRKTDKTAKFPYKFKSYKYFTTFQYDWNSGNGGFKLKDNILTIQGLLNIKLPEYTFKINEGNVKTVTFKKEEGIYFVVFTYSENELSNLRLDKDNFIGIDLGVSKIATLFSNVVDNVGIENSRFTGLEKQVKHIQSLKDGYKKGSRKHKRVAKRYKCLNKRLKDKNKDYQHKVSRVIVDKCINNNIGTLVVGDIKTKKLVSKYRKGLNKSTQGRGTLGRFKAFLKYKAKDAGIDFKLVNEAYTSQENCLTGVREFDSDLGIREVEVKPGLKIDRDLNSAVNIVKRVKELRSKWLGQVEEHLNVFHKMYIDSSSNLCTISV